MKIPQSEKNQQIVKIERTLVNNIWMIDYIYDRESKLGKITYDLYIDNYQTRKRYAIIIKHCAICIYKKKYPKISFAEIASMFGLDHASARFAIIKVDNYINTDSTFANYFKLCESQITVVKYNRKWSQFLHEFDFSKDEIEWIRKLIKT